MTTKKNLVKQVLMSTHLPQQHLVSQQQLLLLAVTNSTSRRLQ